MYSPADLAHSALTIADNREAAWKHAREARAILRTATNDVVALEKWLAAYTGYEPWSVFTGRVMEDLDTAISALVPVDDTRY